MSLLSFPEFNPEVTAESRKRRDLYQREIQRNSIQKENNLNLDEFLLNCDMKLDICDPKNNFLRCHELILRSNQFNISGIKYDSSEFLDLLDSYIFIRRLSLH